MARLARVEVFAADEIAVVHVMARTVRRCFLLGVDGVTGKNYDHRKLWLDDQLVHQARHFGIDLLCQAILSNHIRLVLRSRPDVVGEWGDSEVARRLRRRSRTVITSAQKRANELRVQCSVGSVQCSEKAGDDARESQNPQLAPCGSHSARHLSPVDLDGL
ncbi:MAG: hypothetical protein WKF77_28400 [Planctomycetaceae bacterium]